MKRKTPKTTRKPKKPKLRSLKALKDEAWKWWSIHVRQAGMDEQGFNYCYTCNRRVHWKEGNAGHYRHDAYDYDPKNVKFQCVFCNLGESGRSDNFYLHLVEEYGKEEAERLRKRAKWNNYTRSELEQIIQTYKSK